MSTPVPNSGAHPGEPPVMPDLTVRPAAVPAVHAFSAHAADRGIGAAATPGSLTSGLDEVQSLDPAGRKACTVMKVVSAVILAVAVSPGGDSEDAAIDETTRTLLARAAELADAALPLLGERGKGDAGVLVRNQLRQYAAETVSLQWRLAHAQGYRDLNVDQIMRIYREVDESAFLKEMHALEAGQAGIDRMDPVSGRRLALVAITTELHNAVENFDYRHPEPATLVEAGVRTVVRVADAALAELLPAGVDDATRSTFSRIFLERAGTLYAQNWRAIARKDVKRILEMEPAERLRVMHESRDTGMPTGHIDVAYESLMARLVTLIRDVAPEPVAVATAQVPSQSAAVASSADASQAQSTQSLAVSPTQPIPQPNPGE